MEDLYEVLIRGEKPDDLQSKIIRDYQVGICTADETIKKLVLVSRNRLDMIRFIEDECFSFIDDEQEPTGSELL